MSSISSSTNTLDEPVYTTIFRDVKLIAYKLWHVLIPRGKGIPALRDWDLWGPLILCLVLASMLASEAPNKQAALVFATVFVIVWCGAGVVTINAVLLGGTISFFQSVCVLGYCMAPLVVAAVFLRYIALTFVLKLAVVIGCYLWATTASIGFLSELVPDSRKLLATYPVSLFYLAIAWMILVTKTH